MPNPKYVVDLFDRPAEDGCGGHRDSALVNTFKAAQAWALNKIQTDSWCEPATVIQVSKRFHNQVTTFRLTGEVWVKERYEFYGADGWEVKKYV